MLFEDIAPVALQLAGSELDRLRCDLRGLNVFRNHDGSSSQAGDEIETRTIICFQNPRPEHFDHALLQVCAGNIIQLDPTVQKSVLGRTVVNSKHRETLGKVGAFYSITGEEWKEKAGRP